MIIELSRIRKTNSLLGILKTEDINEVYLSRILMKRYQQLIKQYSSDIGNALTNIIERGM